MTHKSLSYMPHIDGLRAIAVLGVLLFHLDVAVFKGGFAGVDIFFVISGYLITSIILKDMRAGEFSFAAFYARRVRRIFPALFIMLGITAIAAVIFLGPHHFYEFFRSFRFAAGQASNFLFAKEFDYFAIKNDFPPLLHTWSLGVEEQYYLIWPLLLLSLYKWRQNFIWVGLVVVMAYSFAYSEYLMFMNPIHAFYLLPSRAWELALGALLALNRIPTVGKRGADILSLAGLVLIGCSFLWLNEKFFPGTQAIAPCLGAALFIYAAQTETGIGHRIVSWKPLVLTGLVSYSLYLWHWPLIAFYKSYFATTLSPSVQVGIVVLSFVLAVLSYRFVERPARQSKISARKTLALGFAAILVCVVVGNIIKNANDAPWRIHGQMAKDLRDPHDLDKLCAVEGGADNKDGCIIGPNKDRYEVILAGDSLASQYVPMVLAWAKEKNLTVRLYMLGGCKTWMKNKDTASDRAAWRDNRYCQKLSDEFTDVVKGSKGLRYVILGGFLTDASTGTRRSLEAIKGIGKPVYFLGQSPLFEEDPHDCHIKGNLLVARMFPREVKDCFKLDANYSRLKMEPSQKKFKALLKKMDIPYFDAAVPFKNGAVDSEGHFMFRDKDHLNRYGALYLTRPFTEFMED